MQKPTFDPGLTQQVTGKLRRAIERDGSFNVKRRGSTWRDFHPYMYMIGVSWPRFLTIVSISYLALNVAFAGMYCWLSPGQLTNSDAPTAFGRFLNAFFFSSHTLTTVGYGNMAPNSIASNIIASIEALFGLLGFALATGLLFGRFSKPSAKIGFSDNMLVAPYQDKTSLQLRLVNRRPNGLIEISASVVLMTVEGPAGNLRRNFQVLKLERESIYFLALTWTIVHPIEEDSPLFGKTAADMEQLQAEVIVMIKAFDETFSQTVHARYSYRYDELIWGGKFKPAFQIDKDGDMELDLDQLGAHESL